jgi:hypothetical protein
MPDVLTGDLSAKRREELRKGSASADLESNFRAMHSMSFGRDQLYRPSR